MRLSYSAISTYQKCPLSYKFLYVDKLPTKPSHHLSFGSSIHSALEFLYQPGKLGPCTLPELTDELRRIWKRDGYQDESQEQEYLQKGIDILTRYYHTNISQFIPALAVEERFLLPLEDIQISGVIDRIDKTTDENYEIIDYKTNAKMPPEAKMNSDLQLPIYHMAAQHRFGISPQQLSLSLYFLVPGKKKSFKKTEKDIQRAKTTILTIAHQIQSDLDSKDFKPKTGPLCPWCDFIERCPAHLNNPVIIEKARSNGKISETAVSQNDSGQLVLEEIAEIKKQAVEIEDAVDEYFELTTVLTGTRARLQELQQMIHDYCEQNRIDSVSGTRCAIDRKAFKTIHYNSEKLRELLEPRGLWDRIIDVNGALLKQLLDDKQAQSEIRKIIETAKEIEEISYFLYIKDEASDNL